MGLVSRVRVHGRVIDMVSGLADPNNPPRPTDAHLILIREKGRAENLPTTEGSSGEFGQTAEERKEVIQSHPKKWETCSASTGWICRWHLGLKQLG